MSEALTLLQVFVYVVLTGFAFMEWKKRGGRAAAWICAAFGVPAAFFVVDLFGLIGGDNERPWAANLAIALLALYPYSLYSFMSSFVGAGLWMKRLATGATAVVMVWALALPTTNLDQQPAWVDIWVWCFLLQWLTLSGVVIVRLWRAGRGQPIVARRRMRTMSVGTAVLAVAALIEGQFSDATGLTLLVQVLALTAAPFLWIGFAPPYALRQWWRRREDRAVRSSELSLMEATSPVEVAETLLSESCALLGGVGAQLETRDGELVACTGIVPEADAEADGRETETGSVIELEMRTHRLVTFAGEFTPFFGDEEISRLRTLTALADVALERNRLFEEQRHLASVVESSKDAILTVTLDGILTSWNRGAEELYGYTAEEVIDKSVSILMPPGVNDIATVLSLIKSDRPVSNYETKRLTKNGRIVHVALSVSPLRDRSGEIVGGAILARDVTEAVVLRAQQKAIENALRVARLEAERANASKTEFLSRVSHELRTPLNAILGFAQLLELDELTPDQSDSVDQILKGGRRLLELINEVLDISRIESGQLRLSLEPVSVSASVNEALELIRPLAKSRGIELHNEVDGQNIYVDADQQRLGQALLNLLSNAVKYNVDGGSVRVTAEETEAGAIRLRIADTGPGIPRDKLPLLFTPFERLGAEQTAIEGVGLGLALTRSLVVAMGGELELSTSPGEGTTFCIQLRRAELQVEAVQDTARGAHPPHALTGTVLYIEDNHSNLKLVERLLKNRTDVALISAMTGHRGLELAEEHSPDLILLDIHLPDLQGDEVLARLLRDPATSSIPVVILSADATTDQVDRLLGAGAAGYLTKPIDVAAFFRVLDGFLPRASVRVPTDG